MAAAPQVINGLMVYPTARHPTRSAHTPTRAPRAGPNSIPASKIGRFSKLIHEEKRNPRSKTASEVVKIYPEYVKKDRDRDMIYILADPWKISNRIVLIKNRKRLTSETKESDAWFITKVIIGWI